MAQKKITDLQLRDNVEDDVNFPGDDTIQTYRVTAAQIAEYIRTKKRRTGLTTLASGIQSKAIVFDSVMPDDLYTVLPVLENVTDAELQYLQCVVTARSASGFTVSFNAPTDTANYLLNWSAHY